MSNIQEQKIQQGIESYERELTSNKEMQLKAIMRCIYNIYIYRERETYICIYYRLIISHPKVQKFKMFQNLKLFENKISQGENSIPDLILQSEMAGTLRILS
jgi:hypothetical protein